MIFTDILKGEKVTLRCIEESDCNENYRKWMNDPEIAVYLEARWHKQDIPDLLDFVRGIRKSSADYQFAIVENGSGTHIGNIKLGGIHPIYKRGDIGYFIGEKSFWGNGFAKEAVALVTKFGFMTLNLHRIEAGCRENNIGSQKVLEYNGYRKEAVFRDRSFIWNDTQYVNDFFYGQLKSDYIGNVTH